MEYQFSLKLFSDKARWS